MFYFFDKPELSSICKKCWLNSQKYSMTWCLYYLQQSKQRFISHKQKYVNWLQSDFFVFSFFSSLCWEQYKSRSPHYSQSWQYFLSKSTKCLHLIPSLPVGFQAQRCTANLPFVSLQGAARVQTVFLSTHTQWKHSILNPNTCLCNVGTESGSLPAAHLHLRGHNMTRWWTCFWKVTKLGVANRLLL